jgi:hypothetical protein
LVRMFFITVGCKADQPRSKKHFQERTAELQIPPLRFATVGMTKGRSVLSGKVG